MAKQNRRKKKRGRAGSIALFVVEMLVLAVLIAGVYFYARVNAGLRNLTTAHNTPADTTTESGQKIEMDQNVDNVVINPEVQAARVMEGYRNIALVGIDAREETDFDYTNSDTMIICSINNDTGEVKLVSIFRDTYLNTDPSTYDFQKANAAYCNGSIRQFLSMVNANLDLNITDYVIVDFKAVAVLVDDIGGIEVEMTRDEVINMNDYCVETSQVTGMGYNPLPEEAGVYSLNGVQAVSYSRIRYGGGNDMKRARRQRLVIAKIVEKVKQGGLSAMNAVINDVFPLCKTNLSNAMIVQMAAQMIGHYEITATEGFPFVYSWSDQVNPEFVVPVTLTENVKQLHKFLFNEDDYQPSQTVQDYNYAIVTSTGLGEDDIEAARIASTPVNTGSESDRI